MLVTYAVDNINCSSCSNMIKNALESSFGEIEINLNVNPKQVSVFLNTKAQEEKFKDEISEIGFPIIEELSRK